MTIKKLIPLTLLAVLAGCATQPEKSETLTQAQEAVSEAKANPDVTRYAPVALREAEETLERAETAWRSEDDKSRADHLAYLAQKRAQIAQSIAHREAVVRAGLEATDERQQLLLQAREAEAQRAQQEAEQARRELEAARAQLADMQPKQTDRGIVLTLDEVLFPFDSAELKPGTQRTMDRLAQYLEENPDFQILIEGHTDSVGDSAYNQRLSEERADAVRSALAQRGIGADRVSALGLGEDFPVAENSTNPGRAENRRVEVVIAEGTMPPSLQETARPTMARERQLQPQG